jgi:hypothetical protein
LNQDKGCNNGGLWSCLNGGTCNSNGKCICKMGFDGSMCQTCIISFSLKI